MKARVLITTKCNRRCRGCCNKTMVKGVKKVSFEDLFNYDEIIITGGEPMLMADRAVEMLHRLRLGGYKGKIWLYTAFAHRLERYWAVKMLIDEVDGITFTLHYNSRIETLKEDLRSLRKLDKYLSKLEGKERSDRLYIDSRVYKEDYVKSLVNKWAAVKPLVWNKNGECSLPEGEELVFYDLEAEG